MAAELALPDAQPAVRESSPVLSPNRPTGIPADASIPR
jgi:hypothetical protein